MPSEDVLSSATFLLRRDYVPISRHNHATADVPANGDGAAAASNLLPCRFPSPQILASFPATLQSGVRFGERTVNEQGTKERMRMGKTRFSGLFSG
jgi:hypothetical protein